MQEYMVLSESDNIAYGSINKPNSPSLQPQQLQEEAMLKDASFGSSLSRQNCLLSLTLNEIQNKSGKSFGSMNMDEFLANLWTVDENQDEVQTYMSQQQHHQQQQQIKKDNNNGSGFTNKSPPPLGRQGSFSIPSPLCKKTVDEVWFEIQKDEPDDHHQKPNPIDAHEPLLPLQPQRQQTLGEMTLEDFLVKAGIVQEAPPAMHKMQNINACFGMGQVMGMGLISPHQNIANAGFAPPYQIFPPSNPISNDAKNDQAPLDLLAAQQGKKRIIDGPPEVVVERRQRRMIKNRESAARSRARKQAYTVELELELNQLKEENAKLKQLVEEIELNSKEEATKRKPSKKAQKKADKLRSIRRTVSLAW